MESSLSELYNLIKQIIIKANTFYSSEEKNEKNKSITLIKSLIESSFINQLKAYDEIIYASLNAIIYYDLGAFNASNEDPSVCEGPFTQSIKFFNSLPTTVKIKFVNYYQEIFNNLGIIYYNRGEIKKGLEHFAKAEQIYKIFFSDLSSNKENIKNKFIFSNDLAFFINNINNDSTKNMLFNFETTDYAHNKKIFEHNYTLTIFYFAQAFTKLGFRKKAIQFCSVTLKRQIENNEYDIKDAVNNCINLSDFYLESQNFAQTEYILRCALSLIPDDKTKKKKLRAAVQAQLGKYYLERIKLALLLKNKNTSISNEKNMNELLNKKKFMIDNLKDIKFPEIKDVQNIEDVKSLFRKGNTYSKRALEVFVMDGYVTDHIKINQTISQLYKYLIFFESDNARIFAMEERRINILEPMVKAINHKVYVIQWQEISLELAEIFCEIFESNYEIFRNNSKLFEQNKVDEINKYGKKSLFYYEDIITYIENEYGKETEKKFEDFITIITIKSNIARIYSKIIYLNDIKQRVDSLKKSLEIYKQVYQLLKVGKDIFGDKDELKENLVMCEEMIGMLPIKIDKVNRGEEFI
jgi:tetratricopeptide (TPR) repeat protein